MKPLKTWRIRKPAEDSESVYISEKFGVRSLHIGSDTLQGAMRLSRPNDLEVTYTRAMMAFLLFNAAPRKVLMVGLGAGSLAKYVYHQLPEARTVAIEINPQVVGIARQFFCLPPEGERLELVIGDGAEYMQGQQRRADVIMVDGYDAESQVAELSTAEFYRDCARVLGTTGMLVVNLWGGDREFSNCIERMAQAFDGLVACLPAGRPGNIVALAFRRSPGQPSWSELMRRARELENKYGLEFPQFVQGLAAMNPHDAERLLF